MSGKDVPLPLPPVPVPGGGTCTGTIVINTTNGPTGGQITCSWPIGVKSSSGGGNGNRPRPKW